MQSMCSLRETMSHECDSIRSVRRGDKQVRQSCHGRYGYLHRVRSLCVQMSGRRNRTWTSGRNNQISENCSWVEPTLRIRPACGERKTGIKIKHQKSECEKFLPSIQYSTLQLCGLLPNQVEPQDMGHALWKQTCPAKFTRFSANCNYFTARLLYGKEFGGLSVINNFVHAYNLSRLLPLRHQTQSLSWIHPHLA